MKKDKFIVLTLGCSKNLVDSERLIAHLESNGFSFTENINHVSTCIINTCGFIRPSVEESLQVILQAVDLKVKQKIDNLIITGCMSQRFHQEIQNQFPEVDFIAGVDSSEAILRFLKKDEELKYNLIGERKLLTPKHYAYLKISEGCNRQCSFCAIPLIRGKHKSKPLEKILDEVRYLASLGVKELILIAQDSSSYGVDLYGKPNLAKLLWNLSEIKDFRWIRLMYTYPMGLPEDALDVIAEQDNICKYVDIPLQHISDNVLKSMRRGTTRKSIESLLEKIRTKIPNVTIRTTFIVGYPNETEKEFQELLEFIENFKFDRVGVFTYSSEDGTPAFELGDPIPSEEKKLRRNELLKKQMEISYNLNLNMIGKKVLVVIDDFNGKRYIGRTEKDAPEVDNNVIIKNPKDKIEIGKFVEFFVESANAYDIYGTVVIS